MIRPRAYKTKPAPPSDDKFGRIGGLHNKFVAARRAKEAARRAKEAARRAKEIGITEAHVQQTVTQFLELDGWRAIRTEHAIERNDSGGFKRRVGEVGMPDYLYVRYIPRNQDHPPSTIPSGVSELLWIEFKAPGKKPDAHQLRWHEQERARGALVLVVDDIDDFIKRWYPQSGLQRR